ncbi:tRNA (adenosine(37)-N6)-dimethylallyltransferase MiaA [Mangrovibacterium lignilyticum]|uniref:tRNA (adenosine(37)-N6)-dimethylallyltransferase MiaA n=1 Tax=Mangrovibacterium lignilyticum TaxID=2668052 RepID=UPI0013D61DBE|nr:tRNA (adenosine(37)-N6)-dimethylallyltransferase MiaA [Mangrovibacterium lignilyticum]
MPDSKYQMLTILGPTASGKTTVATHAAQMLDGEVISADSRQVYRGMDLGTGKDLVDYIIDGKPIPYHLIDIVDAGYEYNVFEYQNDFLKAYEEVLSHGKFPVLCGGSGLYLESVLKNYKLIQVPLNDELRQRLADKKLDELTEILKTYKPDLHNVTDIVNEKRAIRAIEIEDYLVSHPEVDRSMPDINSLVVGVKYDRLSRRKRITERLKQRLDEGMLDEVQLLLDKGLNPEQLTYYGLEYKHLTLHLTGELSFDEMFRGLETAIHQFAKRQMTWFRRMERQGTKIHWLDGYMPLSEKLEQINLWLGR